jgi:hypothetical protein
MVGATHDRHCERSEAIQRNGGRPSSLDRHVASLLAMTLPPELIALLTKVNGAGVRARSCVH